MDAQTKLLDLFGGARFKVIKSNISVDEFREIARYNQEQYARIETIGEHHEERIINSICLVLAEKLQPLALERFGDISESSLRRIFNEFYSSPKMKLEFGKYRQLTLTTLSDEGLNPQQMKVISEIIDGLPDMIINFLVQ